MVGSQRVFTSRVAVLALATALSSVAIVTAADGGDERLEEWPLTSFPEPSAVVYHPTRRTLFIVGDQGDVGEIDLTGKLINSRNVGGDLEGVTCDPGTGLLYAIREGHEIIFEIDPDKLTLRRRFTIDRTYDGNANYLERGSDGIEGITFRADATHAEGGRFYAVNQFDPPVLVELRVPLKTSDRAFETASIVSAREVKSAPLSDVLWHEPTNRFLITSALWRAVYVTDQEGRRLRSVRIPGFMQEGIAMLPGGAIVIVQDTGGLIKWTPDGDPFASPSEARAGEQEGTEASE